MTRLKWLGGLIRVVRIKAISSMVLARPAGLLGSSQLALRHVFDRATPP